MVEPEEPKSKPKQEPEPPNGSSEPSAYRSVWEDRLHGGDMPGSMKRELTRRGIPLDGSGGKGF